jgi:proton-coupled amino acid transporter
MFAVAIFITYALQCYVPLEIVWNTYIKDRMANDSGRKKLLVEYIMRTCTVIGTCKCCHPCTATFTHKSLQIL